MISQTPKGFALDSPITQAAFAKIVGVTRPAIQDAIRRGVIQKGGTLREWLLGYIGNLREHAAGRVDASERGLSSERARLASEQADRVALVNAQTRRELVRVEHLERVLATVGRRIAGILEAVPVIVKRRHGDIPQEALDMIEAEISRARNEAAGVTLTQAEWDGITGDQPGDRERAEDAGDPDEAAA